MATAQPAPATASTQWPYSPDLASDPCGLPSGTTDLGTGDVTKAQPVNETDKSVDCFYVYATVSDQIALNADLTAQPEIQSIASYQAARFSTQCRVFGQPIAR